MTTYSGVRQTARRVVDGLPLEDGARLRYKLNGRLAIHVSLAIVGLGHVSGVFPLSGLHDPISER